MFYWPFFGSYYELSRSREPLVYRMDNEEIYNKLERIVRETILEVGDDWTSRKIDNITIKYEVKLNKQFFLMFLVAKVY